MFTGIIQAIGTVTASRSVDGGRSLRIASPWSDLEPGESVAVDGACLTVAATSGAAFDVHVITTSLDRTLFDAYADGRRVHLERALRVGDRFGGHLVQGHVDGIGTVRLVAERRDARLLDIGIPREVADVSIRLGSIAIDGVALTVNDIPERDVIQVSLIPFTLEHTTLGARVAGDRVHVEGDTVGKYVRQLMTPWQAAAR